MVFKAIRVRRLSVQQRLGVLTLQGQTKRMSFTLSRTAVFSCSSLATELACTRILRASGSTVHMTGAVSRSRESKTFGALCVSGDIPVQGRGYGAFSPIALHPTRTLLQVPVLSCLLMQYSGRHTPTFGDQPSSPLVENEVRPTSPYSR